MTLVKLTLITLVVLNAAALPGVSAGARAAKARPAAKKTAAEKEAASFLQLVSPLLLSSGAVAAEAEWAAATDVTPEHTGQRTGAGKVHAALAGSPLIIQRTRALLARPRALDDLTARQLQRLALDAAENPGTIPDIVARRVETEARQSSTQDAFEYCLAARPGGGCARPVTANEIDGLLRRSRDLTQRQNVWAASKEIGKPLKAGLIQLQALRNQVARAMGHSSYFALQVADYGMTVGEMMTLLDDTVETTRPLFDGLHCWARNQLALRYERPAPQLLPAHWLGDRWAQQWPGIVEETSLDPFFKGAAPDTIVKSAEDFFVSLGFDRLPETFWRRSDLYPVPPGSPRRKNSHASAWHIDRGLDVRSLMNVEPNEMWFNAAHHELGHVYYYLAYSTPQVPPLLRDGPNRAFHEAIGELAALASQQTPYLLKVGILPRGTGPAPMSWLLQSALESIVFLAWSAGTISHFEHDLYEGALPAADWQRRWWDYVAQYQGVVPPAARADDLCDACTKTHINDHPARYYDYAIATLIKFQLHDHICTRLLKQDVRACDYSGSKEVGDFLRGIMKRGATADWRAVMKEATGQPLSSRALMSFFQPLTEELAKRNAGKDCTR